MPRRGVAALLAVLVITAAPLPAAAATLPAPPPPTTVAPPWDPGYHTLDPHRAVDSRSGLGTPLGPLAPGEQRTLDLAGIGGVPDGAAAVVANLTVTDTTAASHLTAWPTGTARPDASNLNWPAGDTRANLALLPLSPTGTVDVRNNAGTAHLVVDLVGFLDGGPATGMAAVGAHRAVDSRDATGTPLGPLGPGEQRTLDLAGIGGVPDGAAAVVANLTVTDTTASSHLTAWPTGTTRPTASNLNWPAGDTRANLALLPLSPTGTVDVRNNAGTAHLVVDLVGYVDAGPGAALDTTSPVRVVDTRTGAGTAPTALGPGGFRTVTLAGGPSPAPAGARAVVATVTAVGGSTSSYLATWSADRTKPAASTVNWPAGDTRANLAVIPLDPDGRANLFNATGTVDVVVDVVGWLDGPGIDVHLEGVGVLAGDAAVAVVARGGLDADTVSLHLDDPTAPALVTAPAGAGRTDLVIDAGTLGDGPHVLWATATGPGGTVVGARTVTADDRARSWAAVSAVTKQKMNAAGLVGNGVLVAHHGRVVISETNGTFTPDTEMPIASATKWMSGAVIMRLVDRGVLDLDAPIGDLVAGLGPAKRAITLRQLLAFTSGLEPDPACAGAAGTTLTACAESILASPLRSAPGTVYRYGSGHLVVAAHVASLATGSTWDDLVHAELIEPLGLTHTRNGRVLNPNPAGGMISTLADYERFLRAMWNFGELDGVRWLSTAAVEEMQRDQTRGAVMAQVSGIRRTIGSRYGLGHWVDVLAPSGRLELSSPGAFGFHPWVDRQRDLYGIYLVYDTGSGASGGWDVKDEVRAAADS